MDCTPLLKRSEQQLLAGNVTTADVPSECFPQVCEHIFGSADFDLAGSGVYFGTIIQVALFFIFGTLQAFISQCISSGASKHTRLSLARFQSVYSTVFSTGIFFTLAIFISARIRTGQDGVSRLEKSIMRDVVDTHHMLLNLAMVACWVQKAPAGIKATATIRNWGDGASFLVIQGLGLLAMNVKTHLDGIHSTDIANGTARLCSSLHGYPHLHSSSAAPMGYSPFFVGIGLGLLGILIGVLLAIMLPKVWSFLSKVFGGRIFLGTLAVIFALMCMFCVVFGLTHLQFTRQNLQGLPRWDLAQICALLIWFRPGWHVVLASLTSLVAVGPEMTRSKGKVRTVVGLGLEYIYLCCFEPPAIEDEKPKKTDEKETSRSSGTVAQKNAETRSDEQRMDEKANLLIDETIEGEDAGPGQSRSRSPSAFV